MGTTTQHGLPYPEPTDQVAEGANAIRSLAEAVDSKLHAPGQRVFASSIHTPHTDMVMDGNFDHYITDVGSFPFPTVTVCTCSTIWLKCDRQTTVSATLYTTNLTEPGGAGGRTMDRSPSWPSNGAGYNPLGTLQAHHPLAAGGTFVWILRLTGPIGGPTAASYSFTVTLERFAL